MTPLLLAAAIAVQQGTATAVVDRSEVEVGQNLLLTITVEASGNNPVRIFDPQLVGLEVQRTVDRSDVSVRDGVLMRRATREVRLISTQVGAASIGSVRVEVGTSVIVTDPIEVTVLAAPSALTSALKPHIRTMIQARPTPEVPADEVLVEVWTSVDTLVLGEQADVVVLAWFPRDVRSRLRNPPSLQPPSLQGAWTYQEVTPGAIAVSREVEGVWYDVYVHHQVVFPLTPGSLRIGPATVSYSLPLTYSFLSREVQHEPQSEPKELQVLPQPTDGRPTNFDGTSASDLVFDISTLDTLLVVGDAAAVVAAMSGKGNVALWPEPDIRWPEGTRVYPDGVDVDLESRDDGMWGTKTFRYLLVVDSHGTYRIPELTLHYYDPSVQEYASLTTQPLELVTEGTPSRGPSRTGRSRLSLAVVEGGGGAAALVQGWTWWIWIVILIVPPLSVLTVRIAMRIRRKQVPAEREAPSKLEQWESQFTTALAMLVKEPEGLDSDGIVGALVAAGLDRSVAAHAARIRERLWQANYGPEGVVDPEELGAEVAEVVKSLETLESRVLQSGVLAAMALTLMALAVPCAEAQSAERLYETGALQEAADSFRLRAVAEPLIASNWYNLGSALYGVGNDVAAEAAWVRAARLAPRDRRVREALDLLPRMDMTTRSMMWISRVTPAEAFLIAAVLWTVGWILVGFRRRGWAIGAVFALSLALAVFGKRVNAHYQAPVALVSSEAGALREAPYGSARMVRLLEQGSAVFVDRREGNWLLARRANDRGWLLADEVVLP